MGSRKGAANAEASAADDYKTSSTRGRRPRETAQRIRSLVWYAAVAGESGLSRLALQQKYVTYDRPVKDSHTFLRIELEGDDPDSINTKFFDGGDEDLWGLSLVARV